MSFSEKSCIFQMSLPSVTHHRAISILERKHLFCRLGLTFIEKITWHTPNTYQFMKNCFDEFWCDLKLPYLAAERQPLISSSDRNERLCLSQRMPTALKTYEILSYRHISFNFNYYNFQPILNQPVKLENILKVKQEKSLNIECIIILTWET